MTNPTLETLKTRRSCRKYLSKQITDEELNTVLEAGTYAPSARGKQSAKIVVVQDTATKEKISRMNAEIMRSYGGSTYTDTNGDPMYGAPTFVIVFAESNNKNGIQDASLVMGNMMLAAFSIGLGSCWINRAMEEFKTPEGKELLKKWGLGTNWTGVGHCILGYPAEKPAAPKPRKADYIIRV